MSGGSTHPLRQIFAIKRNEWPLALLLFSYFFLVITSFWILKPIKKTVFVEFYKDDGFTLLDLHLTASQAELLAKVLNMVVALIAATVFSLLADRLRRQQLTLTFSAIIFAGFIAYAFLLEQLSAPVVWSFYLFGDLYSTLMVATFFAFANDSLDPSGAKRTYGIIGLGGVMGGAVGSTFVRTSINAISKPQWMMVSLAIGVVIVIIAIIAGRIVDKNPPRAQETQSQTQEEPKVKTHPAIEGAWLIVRSRYLLSLVALVAIYEIVSTVLDFQFTATIEHFSIHGGLDMGQTFATVYSTTNWVALGLQLFVTSFVMQRYGVGIALLFLPFAALGSSIAFAVVPMAFTGGMLSVADNASNYSINQSAREALYTVTSRDEKYKAKAFIDMFVQRTAKAVAVGLNLLITTWVVGLDGLRWLTLLTFPLLAAWIMIALFLGKDFAAREKASS